jgi:transposase
MRDQYIGIDLHKASFQACAVAADGARLWEGRFPRTAAGMEALTRRCTEASALAVEASTPTWHFADAVVGMVGDLRIVDPWKTMLKAGYAAKTDRLDARRLADALRRDSVVGIYYPPPAIRELRELCRHRLAIVQCRTAVINRLRAVLLRQGIADARRLAQTADDSWLEQYALPPRAAASVHGLRQLLAVIRAQALHLTADVNEVAAGDRIATALQQLRGIGPVLALTIRAEIGDIHRFTTAGQLASYAGLVPSVDASARRYRAGRITRRGSPWLRWALVEAAVHGPRRTDRVGRWGRGLAMRKGILKARVALARVLAEEIHRLWTGIA